MSVQLLIVDYGTGNLHSVRQCLRRIGVEPVVSSAAADIVACDKLILPGVGHFGRAMEKLSDLGLIEPLHTAVLERKKPILGICLGMELMARKSEEGNAEGLGWFDAEMTRFKTSDPLTYKVPFIGWNKVSAKKESSLLKGIAEDAEFYFLHSYFMEVSDRSDILNETVYENTYPSAIERDNIFGVQYHPEKSHDAGTQLLKNFIEL
jgi:glutamine amidotransferase